MNKLVIDLGNLKMKSEKHDESEEYFTAAESASSLLSRQDSQPVSPYCMKKHLKLSASDVT